MNIKDFKTKSSDKVKYFVRIFEAILHEILGHKLIKIQCHLKDRNIET